MSHETNAPNEVERVERRKLLGMRFTPCLELLVRDELHPARPDVLHGLVELGPLLGG